MNAKKQNKIVALVGNPNSGKTTLFNALTGTNQKIGNWPGVTVEKKTGYTKLLHANEATEKSEKFAEIVDLPGIYSLTTYSLDEEITCSFILNEKPDLIINIVDVTNLERNLYLTTQLIQLRKPIIVCLNMIDLAEKKGLKIDLKLFEDFLGCPVIPISALKKIGLDGIHHHLESSKEESMYISQVKIPYNDMVLNEVSDLLPAINDLAKKNSIDPFWLALKILEKDPYAIRKFLGEDGSVFERHEIDAITQKIESARTRIYRHTNMQADILIASGIYSYIKSIGKEILKNQTPDKVTVSDKIDAFLLHSFVGIPTFMLVMYLMFMFSITLSRPFTEFIDVFFGGLFVDGFNALLETLNIPFWLRAFLADGLGGGLTTVMTFIPPIFFIFLILTFLEDSGYMARVAFIMDKFMHWLGLSGKSIIPMLVGFGCTVPAIMATRTLENKRDRLMTIMLVPFISCGAKIPVYVMFAMLFFPDKAGLVIFLLYLTGFFFAIVTGKIMKKLVFKGTASEFVMELPAYHIPNINGILLDTWHRLKAFIMRAGKTIIFAIIVLTMINALPIRTSHNALENDTVLTLVGKTITPLFIPMGIEKENWQATVSLIVGLFAKEAIVGSFEALYKDHSAELDNAENWSFPTLFLEAKNSFIEELNNAFYNIINPFQQNVEFMTTHKGDSVNIQKKLFKNIHQVIAYLLFILIYAPCVAAIAASYKEAGKKFATVQTIYLTLLAWVVATIYYNIAAFTIVSIIWFIIAGFVFASLLIMLNKVKIDTFSLCSR